MAIFALFKINRDDYEINHFDLLSLHQIYKQSFDAAKEEQLKTLNMYKNSKNLYEDIRLSYIKDAKETYKNQYSIILGKRNYEIYYEQTHLIEEMDIL